MKERVYNFAAGPATLPEEVIKKAQEDLFTYGDTGMSVMEMTHRSKDFEDIIFGAEESLRNLVGIDDSYKVLFVQGGASTQFAAVPLNLFNKNKKAGYIDTGSWSSKAIKEAQNYGEVEVLASSKEENYTFIPKKDSYQVPSDLDYLHITTNNTIYGTRYDLDCLPKSEGIPLVADASSNILSQKYDINDFGLVYAGAQKNIGPSGVTIVIVKEDLIGNPMDICPTMLNYKTHADKDSLYNTPPTFIIYMCGLVFKWLEKQGGVEAIEEINKEKAGLLYDFIDSSEIFSNPVNKEDRSLMNVTFVTGDEDLDGKFVKEAKDHGLVNLKGHRSVGGMRASIYNAMPLAGVEKLVDFMRKFESENK